MRNRIHLDLHSDYLNKSAICLVLILSLMSTNNSHASNLTSKSVKTKTPATTDLRILVDISGSMKKTDPNNLRRSAVRLLAGLIPKQSKAGIWNFGKQVNMSVKIGSVNESWRELARTQSKKINSVGLYTNIENAMRKASFDWKKPDPRYKRNLILLTDGHVDVSQDDKLDKESRKKILKEILPALEKAKVRIHTIALSDDVDESLLSTLSAYTDGLYKKVNSADELQKLFLQMLEQSVSLDTIPLKDNRFNVDANINDMTLLVFNKDKANPTKIVTPGKRTWDKTTSSDSLKWFSDEGYDLITIKKPQHGQWKIMAPLDPNNRVVVATNLKLKVNQLPGYLMLGDRLNVTAALYEDNKPLSDQRLLSKFNFELTRKPGNSTPRSFPMTKVTGDSTAYSVQLAPIFEAGNNELIIQAKSPTAQREIRHQVKVYAAPAEVNIKENNGKYRVEVTPYSNLVRPDSIKLNVVLKDKTKHELIKQGDSWSVDIDGEFHQSMFDLNIEATRADGKPLSMSFSKVLAVQQGAEKLSPVNKPLKTTAEVKPGTEKKKLSDKKKDKTAANNKKEQAKDKEPEINWTFIIISIVVGNLLLILIFVGGYLYLKRRKQKMAAELGDEMAQEQDATDDDLDKDNGDKKSDE